MTLGRPVAGQEGGPDVGRGIETLADLVEGPELVVRVVVACRIDRDVSVLTRLGLEDLVPGSHHARVHGDGAGSHRGTRHRQGVARGVRTELGEMGVVEHTVPLYSSPQGTCRASGSVYRQLATEKALLLAATDKLM